MSETVPRPDSVTRQPLTPRQREVLGVVKTFIRDHGYAPSMRQLAGLFGWSGPAAAQHHFKLIERKGWLAREPRSPRAMRVIDD